MGVEPPFLYDPPSRYSFNGPTDRGFNPKAATQASWSPPVSKPKPDGPLINFNKHPDSYVIVPYGNLNAKPMSPKANSAIKYSRKVQLGLRVLELLGSLGLLFCVIAIKGTSGSLGWIIRVAPGVALLHTIYAVYHLWRSPTARTAGSSASYMLFAAVVDAGLLPFLAFSAFLAHNEYTTGVYGWETLFGVPLTTLNIVHATFLLCVIEGGFLLLSLGLGIYLAVLFRKISKLPPDLNPLEPNLTARPHKRNKSEFTTSDKHMSQTSLIPNNRMSTTAESLIVPDRRVPFLHTRADSTDSVPIYQNNSARSSRVNVSKPESLYQQPNNSFRGSYIPVNKSFSSPPSRPQSVMAPSISSRQAGTGLDHRPARSSHLVQDDSTWPGANHDGHVSPRETYHQRVTVGGNSQAQPMNDENIPPVSPVSPVSSRPATPEQNGETGYMSIENWYESPRAKNKRSQDYIPIPQHHQPQYSPVLGQQGRHERRGSLYDFDRDLRSPSPRLSPGVQKKNPGPGSNPLGMNPPSPALPEGQFEQVPNNSVNRLSFENEEPKRYPLYDAPVNLPPKSAQRPQGLSRPLSFLGTRSPEKYYGHLRSPVGSVHKPDASDTASNYSKVDSDRTKTMESEYTDIQILDKDDDEDEQAEGEGRGYRDAPWRGEVRGGRGGGGGGGDEYESDRKGRVVSNTGHDLSGGYAGLGTEFGRGMGRRREVSGKLAEEGRMADVSRPSFRPAQARAMTVDTINGNRNGNTNANAKGGAISAAGWARFKGL